MQEPRVCTVISVCLCIKLNHARVLIGAFLRSIDDRSSDYVTIINFFCSILKSK